MTADISLDCSIDENFNQLSNGPSFINSTSTPRKPKKQNQQPTDFSCPHCGKMYMLRHYFLLHVDKCKSQQTKQVSTTDSNISQNVHLDASDVSFSRLGTDLDGSSSFRKPAPPKKTVAQPKKNAASSKKFQKPRHICTYCLKGYASTTTLKTHMRTHVIQAAASRFPNTTDIMEHSHEIGLLALTKVSNGPCLGDSTAEFRELLGYVISISSSEEFKRFCMDICSDMIKSMKKVKFLLPSALINCLMEDQENILSDSDACDSFLKIIDVGDQFSANVSAQFFLKFMLFFTTELLLYISTSFKASHPFRVVSKAVGEPDKEDRQVIYYIAGSIMRGYLKIGKRFPKSKTWCEVVSALKSKVLMPKPEGDISADAEWTDDVDRGALLYINTRSQDLFVKITKVIFSHEKKDGSIDYEAVIKAILTSELACDWDAIMDNSLTENVSLNLLSDVVQFFCRTCGRGIAKRRLNFVRRKPVASLTTRHLAASRKNR